MNNGKDKKHKTTYKEVLMAFYEYLSWALSAGLLTLFIKGI